MSDIVRILLISLLSLAIISCSKNDDSGSSESSGSNIQLSSVKANLSGKSLFISTGNKSTYSTANKSSLTNRSQYKSDSQLENTSLFTLSTDSQLDYGIISDYKLEIDELIPYSNNEYAIATLSYGTYLDYGSEYNQNIRDLNCGILNIEISKISVSCLAEGIVIPNIYHRVLYGYAGKTNDAVIIGKNDELFFSSMPDDSFKQTTDLKCSSGGNQCLYKYNPVNKTTIKLNEGNDYSQFVLLNNNHVVFKSTPSKVYAALLLHNNNDELTTIASTTIPVSEANCCSIDPYHFIGGDYISVLHQGGKIHERDIFTITRYENSKIRKTYINTGMMNLTYFKSNFGKLYFQNGQEGLYQVLPSIKKVIDTPDYVKSDWSTSEYCGSGSVCGVNYMLINDVIAYTNLDNSSGKRALNLKATRVTDNKTISLVTPDNTCSNNCYTRNNYDYVYGRNDDAGNSEGEYTRWNVVGEKLYVEVIDLIDDSEKTLVFDFDKIDFTKNNVYEVLDTNGDLDTKEIKDISGLQQTVTANNPTPTATFIHEDNNTISVQAQFNNSMDYADVESKISIIDNATQQAFGFMPVWINKTLHLVADEDNGTVFDNQSNPFLTGHTYKITLLGSAKDSDGNTLGSDVVKYITP
jgi:hypothetical protein